MLSDRDARTAARVPGAARDVPASESGKEVVNRALRVLLRPRELRPGLSRQPAEDLLIFPPRGTANTGIKA